MKSYGRAPTFLMITGYEQVRSIAADIAGDRDAAERVELELPETGVCTRGGIDAGRGRVRMLRRRGSRRHRRMLCGRRRRQGRRQIRMPMFVEARWGRTPSQSRIEFGVPVEIVEPAVVQIVRRE